MKTKSFIFLISGILLCAGFIAVLVIENRDLRIEVVKLQDTQSKILNENSAVKYSENGLAQDESGKDQKQLGVIPNKKGDLPPLINSRSRFSNLNRLQKSSPSKTQAYC